jgi:hypothetical protein
MMSMLLAIGWDVTPSTVVADSIEEDMLREANAIGAAADAILGKFAMAAPSNTDKATALIEEYDRRMQRLLDYGRAVAAPRSVRTHLSSGEVTLPDEGTTEDDKVSSGIEMDTEF